MPNRPAIDGYLETGTDLPVWRETACQTIVFLVIVVVLSLQAGCEGPIPVYAMESYRGQSAFTGAVITVGGAEEYWFETVVIFTSTSCRMLPCASCVTAELEKTQVRPNSFSHNRTRLELVICTEDNTEGAANSDL